LDYIDNQTAHRSRLAYISRVHRNWLSTKYARRFYAASVREPKAVSRHWKFLLGGGVVTLIVLVYTLRYHSSWPLIIWVILVACLFAATFPAWRDKK
jgi:hypothetical protein